MSEPMPEAPSLRARTLLSMIVGCGCEGDEHDDEGTLVEVEHVYLPEEEVGACTNCGHPHRNPGMVGLAVGEECVLLSDMEALKIAHRLIKGAELVAEADEDPPDIDRDIARFTAAAKEDGP